MESKAEEVVAESPSKDIKLSTGVRRNSLRATDSGAKIESTASQKKLLTIRPDERTPIAKLNTDNNISITNSNQSCAQHMEESKFVNNLVSNLLDNVIENNQDETISREVSSSAVHDRILGIY